MGFAFVLASYWLLRFTCGCFGLYLCFDFSFSVFGVCGFPA